MAEKLIFKNEQFDQYCTPQFQEFILERYSRKELRDIELGGDLWKIILDVYNISRGVGKLAYILNEKKAGYGRLIADAGCSALPKKVSHT